MKNNISDDEDRRLFSRFLDPSLINDVLSCKRNNPYMTYIEIKHTDIKDDLDSMASRRLGNILGNSTTLYSMQLTRCCLDVLELFEGLRSTQSITEIGLSFDMDEIESRRVGAIIGQIASLKYFCFCHCFVEDMAGFLNGLQHNQSIQHISIGQINFQAAEMNNIAPILF